MSERTWVLLTEAPDGDGDYTDTPTNEELGLAARAQLAQLA